MAEAEQATPLSDWWVRVCQEAAFLPRQEGVALMAKAEKQLDMAISAMAEESETQPSLIEQ